MEKVILIDTNVFIRHLRGDDKVLSLKAKAVFSQAETGKHQIYVDEVIIAEVVWVLSSFYKETRAAIAFQLSDILSQTWVINPRKNLILKTLTLFTKTSHSYIDCWAFVVAKDEQFPFTTFDKTLDKLARST